MLTVDHVGIQVDSAEALGELASRLKAAGETTFDQDAATCCYAVSDKSWVTDPAGVRWESFYTHGEAVSYGEDLVPDASDLAAHVPQASQKACC